MLQRQQSSGWREQHMRPPPAGNGEEAIADAAKAQVEIFLSGSLHHSVDSKVNALMGLATWIHGAFGAAAAAMGTEVRAGAGLQRLFDLLYEVEPSINRVALLVLSNLASDAFDPMSCKTKELVEAAAIFPRLVEFAHRGEDVVAQAFACACLQNLCQDVVFAQLLRDFDMARPASPPQSPALPLLRLLQPLSWPPAQLAADASVHRSTRRSIGAAIAVAATSGRGAGAGARVSRGRVTLGPRAPIRGGVPLQHGGGGSARRAAPRYGPPLPRPARLPRAL